MSENQDEKDKATVPDVSSTEFVSPPENGDPDAQTSPISPDVGRLYTTPDQPPEEMESVIVALSDNTFRYGFYHKGYWSVCFPLEYRDDVVGWRAMPAAPAVANGSYLREGGYTPSEEQAVWRWYTLRE